MKKILIVEDDKVLSEMYALKLQKANFEIKEAINGLEGLTIVPEWQPDVILLDLMMPTMNWFETLNAIKQQTSLASKIIVFTNVVDKEKIKEAMDSWADKYLIKANIDPSDVIDTINEVLAEKNDTSTKPLEIKAWLNTFKIKNPIEWADDIEVNVNVKI